ncbi:hypothetical protein B0T20DRAFT_471114 [Sordaria brevicollis]|uniref:Uncharacterized protein n=1 Tax=Sordaria brevicollis TaxID=83679 RepID=A0AAE0U9Q8_SORBR|nr:hypothetical protein B0T20DRAFT_471114 [Sordaria brevicollis]
MPYNNNNQLIKRAPLDVVRARRDDSHDDVQSEVGTECVFYLDRPNQASAQPRSRRKNFTSRVFRPHDAGRGHPSNPVGYGVPLQQPYPSNPDIREIRRREDERWHQDYMAYETPKQKLERREQVKEGMASWKKKTNRYGGPGRNGLNASSSQAQTYEDDDSGGDFESESSDEETQSGAYIEEPSDAFGEGRSRGGRPKHPPIVRQGSTRPSTSQSHSDYSGNQNRSQSRHRLQLRY